MYKYYRRSPLLLAGREWKLLGKPPKSKAITSGAEKARERL